MIKLIIGFVVGFYVATMGLTELAQTIDNGVKFVQTSKIHLETGK